MIEEYIAVRGILKDLPSQHKEAHEQFIAFSGKFLNALSTDEKGVKSKVQQFPGAKIDKEAEILAAKEASKELPAPIFSEFVVSYLGREYLFSFHSNGVHGQNVVNGVITVRALPGNHLVAKNPVEVGRIEYAPNGEIVSSFIPDSQGKFNLGAGHFGRMALVYLVYKDFFGMDK